MGDPHFVETRSPGPPSKSLALDLHKGVLFFNRIFVTTVFSSLSKKKKKHRFLQLPTLYG